MFASAAANTKPFPRRPSNNIERIDPTLVTFALAFINATLANCPVRSRAQRANASWRRNRTRSSKTPPSILVELGLLTTFGSLHLRSWSELSGIGILHACHLPFPVRIGGLLLCRMGFLV
jgi:hypothetical protein